MTKTERMDKMRRYILLPVLILLLLAGCGKVEITPEPTEMVPAQFRFTEDCFPVLDGSESLAPLGRAIASVLLGKTTAEASPFVFDSDTQTALDAIRQENAHGLVLAVDPGVESAAFLKKPIAREALIFVVNADNPVDSLTAEQAAAIYSGAVANWSELGGRDCPVDAYQQRESSASQMLMRNMVMLGKDLAAPQTVSFIPNETDFQMTEIIGEPETARMPFENTPGAIGYTLYRYASAIPEGSGLKILKIGGVFPDANTIADRSYPFSTACAAFLPASTAKDAPERILFEWLGTEEAQKLISEAGYLALGSTEGSKDVFTDWSKFQPESVPMAAIAPASAPKQLQPSDTYGEIVPYTGVLLYQSWENGVGDYVAGKMIGFTDSKGQTISKPFYNAVYQEIWGEDGTDWFWHLRYVDANNHRAASFASRDGRFVCPVDYVNVFSIYEYIVCDRNPEGTEFDVYDRDFRLCMTEQDFFVNGKSTVPTGSYAGRIACRYLDGSGYCLITAAGEVLYDSMELIYVDYPTASSGLPIGRIYVKSTQETICIQPDGSLEVE